MIYLQTQTSERIFLESAQTGLKQPKMQEESFRQAWIDETNRVVSFHKIENAYFFEEKETAFWTIIKALSNHGYKYQ